MFQDYRWLRDDARVSAWYCLEEGDLWRALMCMSTADGWYERARNENRLANDFAKKAKAYDQRDDVWWWAC
jgi:hypothetical protein